MRICEKEQQKCCFAFEHEIFHMFLIPKYTDKISLLIMGRKYLMFTTLVAFNIQVNWGGRGIL